MANIKAYAEEVGSLVAVVARLDVSSDEPPWASQSASPAGCRSPAPGAEWANRLLEHDESLRKAPAGVVIEACRSTFSGDSRRLVDEEELKAKYKELLEQTKTLCNGRLEDLRFEISRLEAARDDIEEQIAFCFEKLDDCGDNQISRAGFVEFICGHGDEGNYQLAMNPEDIQDFFNQMSKGEEVVSYEQFREEVTDGCLLLLHKVIDLRRTQRKRFRDTWF